MSLKKCSKCTNKNREDGDDYSFVNYVGSTINFMRDNLEFKIPVYFIQGEHNLLTPKEKTKLYFNKRKAPKKILFIANCCSWI